MSTQIESTTRRMLASNIYVGLQIFVDGVFLRVTQVGKGEYCGQKTIEVDFDWPEDCKVLHAGFYAEFPAPAGINRQPKQRQQNRPRVPRASGDKPPGQAVTVAIESSSPRQRG